jgi:hypothetical protein
VLLCLDSHMLKGVSVRTQRTLARPPVGIWSWDLLPTPKMSYVPEYSFLPSIVGLLRTFSVVVLFRLSPDLNISFFVNLDMNNIGATTNWTILYVGLA